MNIKIKLFENGKMPEYKTKGASCADCYVRLDRPFIVLKPFEKIIVPLGFGLELPDGYEAVIRPRSGISKEILSIIGTIDSDYRGEINVMLYNYSDRDVIVYDGNRVCQIKIQKSEQFNFEIVDELSITERNDNGFGSTGVN